MPSLRTNAPGLLVATAEELTGKARRRNRAQAYAVVVLARNLQKLMAGECSLDDFRAAYTHETSYPILPEVIVP